MENRLSSCQGLARDLGVNGWGCGYKRVAQGALRRWKCFVLIAVVP